MKKNWLTALSLTWVCLWVVGCGTPSAPLDELREILKEVPTYSIVLEDMKEEGNFFKSYFHKYQILIESESTKTDWREVPEKFYNQYRPFLGLTIWTKKEGKEEAALGPPGYEYVGDARYGQWQTDSRGQSFWVFYGQYRLFSDLLGGGPIYRRDYSTYNQYRSQGRPYYGPNKEFGTAGSLTQRQKPNFYQRARKRQMSRKASFSERVNQRVGRTRTGFRGRSGGRGK